MTPEEFNALCAELEDARLDMRTVEPQSKYTCYEEWYADHIADLDDADKAEAADSHIEVGSQDAAMWKALYEQRGKEIERLRDELETSLMDAEAVRGHMRRFMETNDKLRAKLVSVRHASSIASIADSLNSRRMTVNLEPETAQQWIRTLNWVIALQERTAESPDPDPEMRDFQRKCGDAASVLRVIRSEVNRWSLPEVIQPEELEQWRRNFDRDW